MQADTGEDAGRSMLERERVSAKPPMLGATGKASERERERAKETRVLTNTEDDTEKQENGQREILLQSWCTVARGVTAGSEPAMERRAYQGTRHRETAKR